MGMKHRFSNSTRPQAATGSPMDAALKFLGYSARSVREVERHLDEKQYGEVEVYETVERLKELGLLDDLAFAEAFIRTRLATKPVSRRKLYEQLLSHELPRELIEEALQAVDDPAEQENALAVAEKYARQMEALPADERARRVLQRLLTRGYAYDDAAAAVEACHLDTKE
jgi:regulatory protein